MKLIEDHEAGTYVHGIIEARHPRRALVAALASARGFNGGPPTWAEVDPYDALADVFAQAVDLQATPRIT